MKITVKKITIVAAILAVIGGVLFLAAWGMGADGYISWGRGGLRVGGTGTPETLSRRDIEGVRSVRVDAVGADVEFFPARDFGFEIFTYDGEPEWSLSGGVLTVREFASGFRLFNFAFTALRGGGYTAYIKLYYPEDAPLDELSVSSVSGDVVFPGADGAVRSAAFETTSGGISVESLATGTLTLKTVSGNIRTRGVTSDKARLETSSGDSELELFSGGLEGKTVSGNIDVSAVSLYGRLDSTSGDVTVSAEEADLEIATVSGGVVFTSPAREEDISYDVETVSGNITVNGRGLGKYAQSPRGGRFGIDVNTVSGDVKITFAISPNPS
ncbi:MAG: DUF4097 domain-containing protein [Oscillospiraceae bacterium]|jgi:hypothetical protein|nr:DUF4097 domain-containing protein [Oscillospiraceae bacterium]